MSSTSSRELAASPSDLNEPECEPSRSVRLSRSAKRSSGGTGQRSRSTKMSEHSQPNASLPTPQQETLALMSSAADSHAKTFREPDTALGSLASGRDFGPNLPASLARFDPDTQSWRTSQRCLIEGWEPFAETWPPSGMTRSGRLYPLAPLVLHTCDSECSLWPTPTASMDGRGFGIPLHDRTGRYKKSTVSRVHALVGAHGWRIHPSFTETLMGFPLGWTEIEASETLLPRRSRKSSGGRS